jgi:FAD/FMN-containing dehydrogenase
MPETSAADESPHPANTRQLLSGWGRVPVESCNVQRPDTLPALRDAMSDGCRDYIARGLGRAYGDSALNRDSGVVVQTRMNRMRAFDSSTGVLDCEAGVSLAEIIDCFLPRGWFLPTTPGTKFVTLGGALAADIHGKNHHAVGSIANFVVDFDLMIADGQTLHCSRTENADVFWATLGGMGLTGVITTARLRLVRAPSAYCDVEYRRTPHLDQTLELFAETERQYEYSVAWIDCLARGSSLGRSVLMLGRNAEPHQLSRRAQDHPWQLPRRFAKTVPFNFPSFALNSWSVRAFNALYYARHGHRRAIVDFDTFFYPLDSVQHWNRIYGRRGFVQFQALFPPSTSRAALVELLEQVAESGGASFLAVLKSSGPADEGMLSYLYPGHTLALDFPNTGESLLRLLRRLDELMLRHGGRLYLAKDAMMSAETFAAMYPRLDEFRAVKRRVDPQNRFSSSQARRLRIFE